MNPPSKTTPATPTGSSRLRRLVQSVRFRLTLWFVAILALILGGFSLFIYFRQAEVIRAETANRLSAQSSQLAGYYREVLHSIYEREFEGDETDPFPTENYPLLQSTDMLTLFDPNGQVLQQSANFPAGEESAIYEAWLDAAEASTPIAHSFLQSGGDTARGTYLFVGRDVELEQGMRAVLLVGSPLDPGNQLPRLAFTLSLVYSLTLLVAFGGGYWLANRAMHPVQAITHTAREIGERDLSRRLHLGRDDELGQLADTFDQMLDRLQAAFQRQRQFTGDASHEMRTPLAVIELEAGRALEGRRTAEEYRAALQVIQSENEWMSRLVEQLLTLARMDSEGEILQNEKLDLSEIAVDVVERLTALARRKGVSLLTGQLDEALVWADRTLLTHVVTNLVENGLKYAQGDGARVIVETGSSLRQEQPWAWVRIADNGPGIPSEHLPHLFNRFYRVDAARKQERGNHGAVAPGSGLGLAIVRSIVHVMGGEVEVRSQEGEGSVFTVWLPERG